MQLFEHFKFQNIPAFRTEIFKPRGLHVISKHSQLSLYLQYPQSLKALKHTHTPLTAISCMKFHVILW